MKRELTNANFETNQFKKLKTELLLKGFVTETEAEQLTDQQLNLYLELLQKEAAMVDEAINSSIISQSTASQTETRQIDEFMRRSNIVLKNEDIKSIRENLKQIKWNFEDKTRTILEENKGADEREETKRDNIINFFEESLDAFNKSLQEKYQRLTNIPQIDGIILFGSRINPQKKPRIKSDIDVILILNNDDAHFLTDDFFQFVQRKFKELHNEEIIIQMFDYCDTNHIQSYLKDLKETPKNKRSIVNFLNTNSGIDKNMALIAKDEETLNDLELLTENDRKTDWEEKFYRKKIRSLFGLCDIDI